MQQCVKGDGCLDLIKLCDLIKLDATLQPYLGSIK